MSANKKTTAKASTSPAPATKDTKSAARPKSSAPKVAAKKTASATAAIVAAVTRAAAPVLTEPVALPRVKEVAIPAVCTTITAKIDVGFGNALFLRGDGPGLSWDRGMPMTNVGADLWQVKLRETTRPIGFKFLVNDLTWSTGADFLIASGGDELFTPAF